MIRSSLAIDTLLNIPDSFEADYDIYHNDRQVGLMQRQFLSEENNTYTFKSEAKTTGLAAFFKTVRIIESSHGYINNATLTPLQYNYHHTKGKKKRDVVIRFDWQEKQITNQVNDSIWLMETQPGMYDKLLYQLAIMVDLKAGKMPTLYTIVDGGKVKSYRFAYMQDETLKTPLGTFKTIKLARNKPNSLQETFLWCAYDLHFLPIKVSGKNKDGDTTTAIIKSLIGLDFKQNNIESQRSLYKPITLD